MPSPCRVVPCWVNAIYLPRHAGRTPLAASCEKSRTLTSHTARCAGGMLGHIPLPPGGRGAGKVYDHAADAVHPRRPGVGVAGLAGDVVHGDGKGIVAAVLLPGQPDAPHPLRSAHKGLCAQHGTAVSPCGIRSQ